VASAGALYAAGRRPPDPRQDAETLQAAAAGDTLRCYHLKISPSSRPYRWSWFASRLSDQCIVGDTRHSGANESIAEGVFMDAPNQEFALAGSLDDLKAKGRLVMHGSHRPILVIYDRGRAGQSLPAHGLSARARHTAS
jgi:hypothetical protein